MLLRRSLRIGLSAAVLMVMFALATTSLRAMSPTFDEQGFIVRGLAYLRGDGEEGSRRIRVGHPLGLNALNAAFLVDDPSVRLPVDDPSWSGTDFHRPAELFLWEIGNDVDHIMFLSRLPTIWLGLLLAALGGRWAGEAAGLWRTAKGRPMGEVAGLLALALLAFDPNILAHTRLATTDLGLAAAATLAGYTLWLFLRRPSWSRSVAAGIALGLLLNTKFTSLLFLPLFGAVTLVGILWQRRGRLDSRPDWSSLLLMTVVVYPIIALLALWAAYGFQIGQLPESLPAMGALGGRTLPLSHHLEQLLDIFGRLEAATPAFLRGRYSDAGWWYYFPIAFLLKTPLPVLILLGWIFLRIAINAMQRTISWKDGHYLDLAAWLVPSLSYFAVALTTDINLGYRHLLPVLPFLYVLTGVVVGSSAATSSSQRPKERRFARTAAAVWAGVLVVWLAAVTLWIHPYYLAFFNLLAGGPDNGWRSLVDSNLDWGQDLKGLSKWIEARDADWVWLSYFGEARPEYYGIPYQGLDSFPPRLMNPAARSFVPSDPAPGWYAVSATNLQGVHFADHDQFSFFREQTPADKIGYSIFLYEVPARGRPVDLLLTGVQPGEIAPDDFRLLQTNDVRLRWFDGDQSLIAPNGERPVWLAESSARPVHPDLRPFLEAMGPQPRTEQEAYRLFELANTPSQDSGRSPAELSDGVGRIALLDAPQQIVNENEIRLTTRWRQLGEPRPVKMFVHLLNESGDIVSQWDGLGAAWEGWRTGDVLIQRHTLPLPSNPAPGNYRLVAGLYHPTGLTRWTSPNGDDRIQLTNLVFPVEP